MARSLPSSNPTPSSELANPPRLLRDQLMTTPDFAPQVPPADSLVVLISEIYSETHQSGRPVRRRRYRDVFLGFQLAGMPSHVMTAGHCIEFAQPVGMTLVRTEASVIRALPYPIWVKLRGLQRFDTAVLEELGAQDVLSLRSEYPKSAKQLQSVRKGKPTVLINAKRDVAVLKLAGPLTGVKGLTPAAWTTMFRLGTPFFSIGLPLEKEEGGSSKPNIPRTAIYSCYQEFDSPVILSAETKSFQLSSVAMSGFSGGPLCARKQDIMAPTLGDALAVLIRPFFPKLEAPKQPPCPPSTRQAGVTVPAVDPVTGEELRYPTGESIPVEAVFSTEREYVGTGVQIATHYCNPICTIWALCKLTTNVCCT